MDARLQWMPVQGWEDLPSYANVWLYARFMDEPGQGRTVLNITHMADTLHLSRRTIKDYVRRCREKGYFRWISWVSSDWVEVSYTGLPKVIATKSGPGNLQAHIGLADLKHKKAILVAAIAKSKQEQSYHNVWEGIEAPKEFRGYHMLSYDEVFGGRASVTASGGRSFVQFRTRRFTFVKAETPTFGASIPTMAKEIGRSPRTVRRRLSASYRAKLSTRLGSKLDPIRKTQIAVDVGPEAAAKFFASESLGRDRELITAFGRSWRPGCNIYQIDLDTRGQKRLNRKIRRAEFQLIQTLDEEPIGCKE